MLILNDDMLLLLWKYYIKNNVKCIKNKEAVNSFFVCRKMYEIFKENKKKLIQWDCKMLIITNINYKICSTHDNIGIEYVNKLVKQIEKYISLQEPPNNDVIGINFHKYHVTNFIHCPDLKKNEIFVKKILEKYNLKIIRYCCGGDGCELRQIK